MIKATINYNFLSSALNQHGPWAGQKINVNKDWVIEALQFKIKTLNWNEAVSDIKRFLPPRSISTLKMWTPDFFLGWLHNWEHAPFNKKSN